MVFSGTVSISARPERLAPFLWSPFSRLCSCPRQWPCDEASGLEHGDLSGNAFYEWPDSLAVSSRDCNRAMSQTWVVSASVKSLSSKKGKKSGEGNGRILSWPQSYLSGIVNGAGMILLLFSTHHPFAEKQPKKRNWWSVSK